VPQELVSALFDRWSGQPILVIGGGPSVSDDLPKLLVAGVKPACVISANEHGFRQKYFPVDLVTNVDKIHCMEKRPMEQILRPFGVPIVNRHSWADFRLADWTFCGNTGLTAIALACALGGYPVIVTGIDMWKTGRVYFHDKPGTVKPARRQIRASVSRRTREKLKPLTLFAKGTPVRPMSGPLTEFFPKFDPAEVLPGRNETSYTQKMRNSPTVRAEVIHSFIFTGQDPVRAGAQLALSPKEAQDAKILTKAKRTA
jgi:hypothetical protein